MDRRAFIGALGGGLLAAPLAAEAQPAGKVWRIGSIVGEATTPPGQGEFWDRMRQLGWVYGQNVLFERRVFGGDVERVPELAKELIRWGADVILVINTATARRVQQVTRTIPIVTITAGNLVEAGLAASLARPGGNVTGIQSMEEDVAGKQVELLKETIPRLSRVGILVGQPGYSEAELHSKGAPAAYIRAVKANARTSGLHTEVVIVRDGNDFERAFSALREQRMQAIIVYGGVFFFSFRKTIADLALKHRLPTMCLYRIFMSAGFLMAYGWDPRPTSRLVADTVDKILRGIKASEIPIQQPTSFELIINLKTAKALGLTIPPSLLGRADEVIE